MRTEEKQVQVGQQMKPGTNIAQLPRILCRNCGKPIAWGTLPTFTPGQLLLLKCMRRECQQFNQFDGTGNREGVA